MNEVMRSRRLELKMTQQELAEKVGVSRVFINKIETGKAKKCMVHTAFRIAEALQMKAEDLFRENRSQM